MVIKNLKGGISIINIVIILGLIFLAYFGYTQYLDDKIKTDLISPEHTVKPKTVQAPTATAGSSSENKTANKNITPQPTLTPAPLTPLASRKGYYKNNTYFYEISFPESWPIKVRSEDNVALGTVPPQNGQGAITIEITEGQTNNEIKQAKAEAAKYPGIVSLTEQPITLAGVTGTELILNNFMTKAKNIYILLIKNNLNYIIKYSEESAEFSKAAEQALTTFKFTK